MNIVQHGQYSLLDGQKRILEMIAKGAPLRETLDQLVLLIEAHEPGSRCGILIVTDDGAHFRRGSGPNLPEDYHQALHGVPITPPYLGACGEVADTGRAITVPDIASDPRYSGQWRDLVLSCGLASLRSTPVFATDGRALASFALYYSEPRHPDPEHPGVIETATHLASIALERDEAARKSQEQEAALRESQANLRLALDIGRLGRWELDLATGVLTASEKCKGNFGYGPDEPFGYEELRAAIHPDDLDRQAEAVEAAIRSRTGFEIDYRLFTPGGELRWIDVRGRYADDPSRLIGVSQDITERKTTETALRASEEGLAVELAATQQLQRISTALIQESDIDALYREIVEAASVVMRSDAASMQMLDEGERELRLLAWKGFHPASAAFWERVRLDSASSCGAALSEGGRIVVQDVETCDFMAGTEDLDQYLASGLHAVQSTPLTSRDGRLLGMISTHWREAREISDCDLVRLDVLARQAADLIDSMNAVQAVQESQQRMRLIFDGAREYAIIALDRNGLVTDWNSGAERILGYSEEEVLGQHGRIFFPREDIAAEVPEAEMDTASREGRAENERWHVRKDGRRFWASGLMVPLGQGRQQGFLKIFRDLTAWKEAQDHQRMLIHELNHRVKNSLATCQSIAMQTLQGATIEPHIRDALQSRLIALSRSHDVLTREKWSGADLRAVIVQAIEPFATAGSGIAHFEIEGEDVRLTPKVTLTLAMAMHELATNASKYGALTMPDGRVRVTWAIEPSPEGERLRLTWRERNGPPVTAPSRKGFGSRLIERGLAYDLKGTVRLDYPPEGLVCEIDMPRPDAGGSNS